jgi:predicted HAD superfamily Cof-like phosphohydrolase
MKTFFDDVRDFHEKFNLPVTGVERCTHMTEEIAMYRIRFLSEELEEFIDAVNERNLAAQLDALVDLAWVAMGTAHFMGAPFNEAWAEVVRANMSKVLKKENDGEHKRGMVETIRKPPGWQGPRIQQVIEIHNANMAERKL